MSQKNTEIFENIMYVFSSGEAGNTISPIMLQADLELLFIVSLEKIFKAQGLCGPDINKFNQTELFILMNDDCKRLMKIALKNPRLNKKFDFIKEFVKDEDLITKCKKYLEQKILTSVKLEKEFDDDGMHQVFHVPEVKTIRALIDFLFAIEMKMPDTKMATFTAHIYIAIIQTVMKYLKLQKINCKKVSGGIAIYQDSTSMYEDKTVIVSGSVDFIKNRLDIQQFPFEISPVALLEKTDIDTGEKLSDKDKLTLERIESVAMHAKLTKGTVIFSGSIG
jgi:hypothetical protein